MAKSKHPKLLPKALSNIAGLNSSKKDNAVYLKKLNSLCSGTISTADAVIKNSDAQYKYLQDVIDRYARKVTEIQEEESKDQPDKKSVAKLDKEADKIRKEYNNGVKVLADLSQAMLEQMTKLRSTADSRGFTQFNAL